MNTFILIIAIIAIEFIGLCITQELWIIGLIFITFAAWVLYSDSIGATKLGEKRAVYMMSLYAFISGLLIIFSKDIDLLVDDMLKNNFETEPFIFFCVFDGIFLLLGIYKGIVVPMRCSDEVTGTYAGASKVGVYRGRRKYCPIFTYYYEGKTYTNIANDVCSQRKVKKIADKGKVTIYVNPNKPSEIVVSKIPNRDARIMLIFGIIGIIGIIGVFLI